jgi:hypothetical protein
MQRQISNWRKGLSTLAEPGRGCLKLNANRVQKYGVTIAKEIPQLADKLKQKVQANTVGIRMY